MYEQALVIDVATHDLIGESVSVNNLANLALDVGEVDRLIGFAEGLADACGGEFDPMERRVHARAIEALRTELGDDVSAMERKAGRSMTDAEAVDYARIP